MIFTYLPNRPASAAIPRPAPNMTAKAIVNTPIAAEANTFSTSQPAKILLMIRNRKNAMLTSPNTPPVTARNAPPILPKSL